MKTGTRIVSTALGGALGLAAISGLHAADAWSTKTMKPRMAASIDAGSKHVVGFFVNADGVCKLTAMIADQGAEAEAAAPLQLQLTIEPGRTARFATVDGNALRFVCLGRAEAMTVTSLNRVASQRDAE
jgi:hypothetical protein